MLVSNPAIASFLSFVILIIGIVILLLIIGFVGKLLIRLIVGVIANSILGFIALGLISYLFGITITAGCKEGIKEGWGKKSKRRRCL